MEYKLKRRTYLCASIDKVVAKIYSLLDPIVTLTSIHLLFASNFLFKSCDWLKCGVIGKTLYARC